jgi:rSAM/selenodomain-associated transferase 2
MDRPETLTDPHKPYGLSVVIPTLNAAARLGACLQAVSGMAAQVVVVDGGSHDGTRAVARDAGALVIDSPPGRGRQLRAGALAAQGPWLMVLHADTRLAPGWADAVARFQKRADAQDRAAYFQLAFDAQGPGAERVARLANWRAQALGLPYGDQGLLLHRDFYTRLGGFDDIAIMEDVALVRRIGRARLVGLDATAVTSAERYARDGWLLRPLRNLTCLMLYGLGLPPRWIARLYA